MPINQYILFRDEAGLLASQADAVAASLGGTLAAITDAAENTLVESLLALDPLAWSFEPRDTAKNGPWIGLTQPPGSAEPGGGWTWATGEAYAYTHWHSGQPDNFLGDNRVIYWDDAGSIGWADHVNDPVAAGYGAVKTGLAEISVGQHRLDGTAGHDLIWAADIKNRIFGQDGDDLLYGNGGKDSLSGGTGNDLLDGGTGNDELIAGRGDDTLVGGKGLDLLTGNAGADVFRFLDIADSRPAVAGADVILDYDKSQGDRIDLSAIDAIPLGADDAFVLVTGAFTAAGQMRIVAAGADTAIQLNTDGDAGVEMTILVSNAHTAADLVFDL